MGCFCRIADDRDSRIAGNSMKSVAIIAMGASNQEWFRRCYRGDSSEFFEKGAMENISMALSDFQITQEEQNLLLGVAQQAGKRKLLSEIGQPFNEVWAINHMGKLLRDVDLIIAMDDLMREKERYEGMLNTDVPVLTSKAYDEFNCIEYPLREVIKDLNPTESSYLGTYLRNSVTFAVAYAIYKKFDRISLYGCDFYYDGGSKSEQARANCEFWLGFAHARGIKIEVSKGSTTLDMNKPHIFYGYKDQPQIPFNEEQDLGWNGKGWEFVATKTEISSSAPEDRGPEVREVVVEAVRSCQTAK